VGSVRQFDNRLLQFLLKAHRPDLYGDRGKAAGSGTGPRASRPVRDAGAAP
jgi:flagellar biosynthesis/type III secretory pathway chaperone